jgi:Protein of unknown function (DUF1203)
MLDLPARHQSSLREQPSGKRYAKNYRIGVTCVTLVTLKGGSTLKARCGTRATRGSDKAVSSHQKESKMAYRVTGLQREPFAALFDMDDAQLAEHGAVRVTAGADKGWPCRVSLEDAKAGESLILVNHVSHDVATPYRSAYAIYLSETAGESANYIDETPPVFEGRPMAFRAFDKAGMLQDAALALPGEADAKIRELFESDDIAYIHAHNAAHGCFSAKVERV